MQPQFNSKQHCVTFVVAEVALKQIFLQVSSVFSAQNHHTTGPYWSATEVCDTPDQTAHYRMFLELCSITLIQHLAGHTVRPFLSFYTLSHCLLQTDAMNYLLYIKVKLPVTGPVVAQRVGRGKALLFHDCSTGRGWVVSSTPWPYFTSGEDQVPIEQEAGWAPGPTRTGVKSRPTRIRSPDRPARSQSLYQLSYPAHYLLYIYNKK